jgi:transcriptional regulator with GAF, ATPase, and Fis domain
MAKKDSVLSRAIEASGREAAEQLIIDAFNRTKTLQGAAEWLGMSQGTLGYFMRKLGLKIETTRLLVRE